MEKIKIGKIINTHGIKGECKVDIYDDFDMECFMGKLIITNGSEQQVLSTNSTRMHKGFLLIKFDEIDDMNKAEAIKNYEILVDEDLLPPAEDGFYNYELIGMEVFNEDKQLLGKVKAIESTLAHDILRIQAVSGKDILVPMVSAFILDINLDDEYIQIKVIEGLI